MLNSEPVEFFQKGCNMTHFVKSEDGYVGLAYPIE